MRQKRENDASATYFGTFRPFAANHMASRKRLLHNLLRIRRAADPVRSQSKPTAGKSLIEEFSRDGDPFSMTFMVQQAAHIADDLEKVRQLLDGDRDSWLQVKIGAKTVEVQVTNLLVQSRQQAEQLRKLLVDIRAQRVAIDEAGDSDDDVLGGPDD